MSISLTQVRHPINFDIDLATAQQDFTDLIADASKTLDQIEKESSPTYQNTIAEMDRATLQLERAFGVFSHLESVRTTDQLRALVGSISPQVSAFFSSIALRPDLYRQIKQVQQKAESGKEELSALEKRYLTKTLENFERHGAKLPPEKKKRLTEIDIRLTEVTQKFSENALDATNSWSLTLNGEARLSGIPESSRQMFAAWAKKAEPDSQGNYRLTLQAPSVIAVLTYADDRSLREEIYSAFNQRAAVAPYDNVPLIHETLELRREKAALLGFKDFADYALVERMAKDGGRAFDFAADLEKRTRAFFEQETKELTEFAKTLGLSSLRPWDAGYVAEKLRASRYDFDPETVRDYFAANNVLDGLFSLAKHLYGVEVRPSALTGWHADVNVFELAEAGKVRGVFYVDLFPRSDKRGGAWMDALLFPEAGSPAVGLFCANATPPGSDGKAYLTHDEVETLFHEFGHLLHHLLSDVPIRTLSGTNVAWDFVELPSQIMENWAWEKPVLDLFAKHKVTGQPIPDDLFNKMTAAKNFRTASAQMRQISFAKLDLLLHRDYQPQKDGPLLDYAKRIMNDFAATPLPDNYAMIASFSHLFANPVGYAAGYYSYKWAEVLDADAYEKFKEAGSPLDGQTGALFRTHILSKGSSEDPEVLYRNFRGRDPKPDALFERQGLMAR